MLRRKRVWGCVLGTAVDPGRGCQEQFCTSSSLKLAEPRRGSEPFSFQLCKAFCFGNVPEL